MNATRYRIAVVIWILLDAWWSFLPLSAYKQPPVVRDAMEHAGRGAILPPSDTLADGFLLAMVVAAVGLFFFYRWGRKLFVVVTVVNLGISLLLGVGVTGPVDGTVGFFMTLLHGALVAWSFSPPIAQMFAGEAAKADTEPVAIYETKDADAATRIHTLLASASIDYTSKVFVSPQDEVTAKDVLELGRSNSE